MVAVEWVLFIKPFLVKHAWTWRFFFILLFLTHVGKTEGMSQDADSTYYINFPRDLTTRIYTSRKFTSLLIKDKTTDRDFRFDPNSTFNLGVGLTYKGFTLNLAYGFNFLNPEIGKGPSKYFDFQTHLYPKYWVVDVFMQFYKGYHLADKAFVKESSNGYYKFPDMRIQKVGANVQRLFNGDKISLRAAFLQTEWQKRSAGSLLAGMEIYGGGAFNPNGILPNEFINPDRDFNEFRFFQFGPNAGYVHTFVIKKHFFITGSASTNLNLAYNTFEYPDQKSHSWGVNSNLFLRGYLGYNSEKWSINTNYVHNSVKLMGVEDFNNRFNTGNYRVNFVYRFAVGPKLKPYLDYLDLKKYL